MAEITFGTYSSVNLNGSGLGFYGPSFGSSVQIGSYQDKTFITDSNGTINGGNAHNLKFTHAASGQPDTITSGIPLTRINGFHRTLDINFDHSTDVNVQNVQLRIYDRVNVDHPASGVNTKTCEMVNFNGQTYANWKATPGDANVVTDGIGGQPYGSGDHVWWGEPWNPSDCDIFTYQNSSGVTFYNASTNAAVLNGDVRLGQVTGDDDTVGGSGVVMPLLNSPGSGQRFLDGTYDPAVRPKWQHYCNQSSTVLPGTVARDTTRTFGGTGVDKRHTWRVGLSSTPLTIGSKLYSLYLSLEYL